MADYEKQAREWLMARTRHHISEGQVCAWVWTDMLAAEFERIARDARAEERARCYQIVKGYLHMGDGAVWRASEAILAAGGTEKGAGDEDRHED